MRSRAFDDHSLPYAQNCSHQAGYAATVTSVMWWDHADARWEYSVEGTGAEPYPEEGTVKVRGSWHQKMLTGKSLAVVNEEQPPASVVVWERERDRHERMAEAQPRMA